MTEEIEGLPRKVNHSCSFCGKKVEEVKKLIQGPSVAICDECVDLCDYVISEDEYLEMPELTAEKSLRLLPPMDKVRAYTKVGNKLFSSVFDKHHIELLINGQQGGRESPTLMQELNLGLALQFEQKIIFVDTHAEVKKL